MEIYQIIVLIFVIFTFSRTILRFRENRVSVSEFFFWSTIWFVIILVAFIPDVVIFLSESVGIGRGVDFAMYVSIGLLFYLVFRLAVKVEHIDQNITRIVRRIAFERKK